MQERRLPFPAGPVSWLSEAALLVAEAHESPEERQPSPIPRQVWRQSPGHVAPAMDSSVQGGRARD
jgi:hypothetical protein